MKVENIIFDYDSKFAMNYAINIFKKLFMAMVALMEETCLMTQMTQHLRKVGHTIGPLVKQIYINFINY